MRIGPAGVEAFLAAPPEAIAAVLLHGPDAALVLERAQALARAIVPDPRDAFRRADLTEAELRADPARLADEYAALSLMGGRRVIRIRDVTETGKSLLGPFLEEVEAGTLAGDNLVILEAGELRKDSALLALFEDARRAASLACRPDGPAELGGLVDVWARTNALAVDGDVRALLAEALAGDRARARGELEKLALYVGPGGAVPRPVTLADVQAVLSELPEAGLFPLIDAACRGDTRRVLADLPLVLVDAGAVAAVLLLTDRIRRLQGGGGRG
ncbi:MAG: DNA polymerase III subunit delta, partial [Alphaproteobacteria bacterium]|nr:DNA polymerase III subunit delta [Alphaproteobacteria bacterium]